MTDKEKENGENEQAEVIEVVPVDSPSENALVTEQLQRMPSMFSRGLIYVIVSLLVVSIVYSITGTMDIVATCRAVVRPLSHKIRIQSDINGNLEEIYITEGQEVNEGDPLYLVRAVESTEHTEEVKRLKLGQNLSTLKSIDSEMSYWRKEVARLSRDLKNLEDLLKSGIISAREYNDTKSRLEKSRTELRKLNSRREITLNENKILEEEMAKFKEESEKTIKAESAGTISEMMFRNKGEVVRASEVLCTIVPTDSPLYMDIKMANRDIGFIEKDMEIKYKLDAFPFQDYGMLYGKVSVIPPSAVEDQALGFIYQVQGTIDKPYFEIRGKNYPVKVGMTAIAEVVTETKSIFAMLFKKFKGAN
jgi:multidrug efflux pump subunit AcrA (membrane-fusion protein)